MDDDQDEPCHSLTIDEYMAARQAEAHTVSDIDRRATYGRLGAAVFVEGQTKLLTVAAPSVRGDIVVGAGAVTWVDPMLDMVYSDGGTVWKTSLTGVRDEPQASFAEEVIAWCRREAEKGDQRKVVLKAKEEPDYSGVKPNIPRLKASDLLKAGVLCVPENDEAPDPEKVGTDLLVFGATSRGDFSQWLHAKWDRASSGWVEKSDGYTVYDIECWMLPPALKE